MNIFTKLERFLHPSKYKGDRITKPLALVKDKDYLFVLMLKTNPFDFRVDDEELYYMSHSLYGADVIKAQLINREVFPRHEYWNVYSEEFSTFGGGGWARQTFAIKFGEKTKEIISHHRIVRQDNYFFFVSTDKKYLAKTLIKLEKNVALLLQCEKGWKETYHYEDLIAFKRQLSSLRFKLMRI